MTHRLKTQTNKYFIKQTIAPAFFDATSSIAYTTQPTLHLYHVCKTVWFSKN